MLYRVGPGQSCVLTTACMLGEVPYPADGVTESSVSALAIEADRKFKPPVQADPCSRNRADGERERPSAISRRAQWNPSTREIVLPEGMELDFGGIGKEYAVDCVADWAAKECDFPVLVNFGGDLRCTGRPPASGALATSGDARRSIVIDGVRYGHIFDARTGWPVPGTPRSITVAADTCSQAGSYSTLAMLQGAGAEVFLAGEGIRYWCLR